MGPAGVCTTCVEWVNCFSEDDMEIKKQEFLELLHAMSRQYVQEILGHYNPIRKVIGPQPELDKAIKEREASILHFIDYVRERL